jgi:hypothetical protein
VISETLVGLVVNGPILAEIMVISEAWMTGSGIIMMLYRGLAMKNMGI